ncbi:MAG: hypothetical protein M3M93_02320, partial [Actinomycetota bacterium]|nr:hypothetical protein [Actinomycetota bacterium]
GGPGTLGHAMAIRDETALRREANWSPDDDDLLDESARSAHRGWLFASIVALDALAILGFVVWVVIPKLT